MRALTPNVHPIPADGDRDTTFKTHVARVLMKLGLRDRIQSVVLAYETAAYEGEWELPVLGPVTAPSAALVRPDGYVGWVGEGTDLGLTDALTTWFGPRTAT